MKSSVGSCWLKTGSREERLDSRRERVVRVSRRVCLQPAVSSAVVDFNE